MNGRGGCLKLWGSLITDKGRIRYSFSKLQPARFNTGHNYLLKWEELRNSPALGVPVPKVHVSARKRQAQMGIKYVSCWTRVHRSCCSRKPAVPSPALCSSSVWVCDGHLKPESSLLVTSCWETLQSQLKVVIIILTVIIIVPIPATTVICTNIDQDHLVLRAVGTLCSN